MTDVIDINGKDNNTALLNCAQQYWNSQGSDN